MNTEKNTSNGSKKVRLASIGIGMIGLVHAQILSHMEECKYVAISDADPSKKRLAEKLGVRYYSDYKKMIENEDLDGVVVAVPNELHKTIGVYCAEHSLNILMEKPITSTIKEAEELIKSVEKNNVELLIGHHRRFNPLIVAVKELIGRGDLGKIVGVSMLWGMYKPSEYFKIGSWRKYKGGGPILINLIHEVDNLRYIYGRKIERVYAEVSNETRNFEVEDTVGVTMRFNDGVIANILMSDTAPSPWAYEATMGENSFFYQTNGNIYYFFGDKASLSFPEMKKIFYRNSSKAGWQYPLNIKNIHIKRRNPYPEQLKHFCKVINGLEKPRTSGRDGLTTLRVTMAIKESGEKNQPVKLVD